jgi:hypothetical protein
MTDTELIEHVCEIADPDQITREASDRLTRIAVVCLMCEEELTEDDRAFLTGFLPDKE